MMFAPIMFILLLGVVFIIVYVIRKGLGKISMTYKMTYKMKYKILIGYVVLLLIGTVLYFSFFQDKLEILKDEAIDVPDIYDIVYDNPRNIRDLSDEWKVEDWEFSTNSQEIDVQLYVGFTDGGFNVPVIVEEHDRDDEMVQATLYHLPPVYGRTPLDEEKIIPEVRLDDATFKFTYPSEIQELNYYELGTDMIHQHFNPRNSSDDAYLRLDGGEILYLSVPKGMKVHSKEEFFDVIEIS